MSFDRMRKLSCMGFAKSLEGTTSDSNGEGGIMQGETADHNAR